MWTVSAFFTAYSARRGSDPVEVIAIVVGDGDEPAVRYIVVDEAGRSSIALPEDLDLYGAVEEIEDEEPVPPSD